MSDEENVGRKKEDELKSGATSLIPEVYYDLIARVPAGTLLVLFTLYSVLKSQRLSVPQGSTWLSANSAPVLVLAVGLMGVGGLTGLAISPLADLCRSFYWKRAWLAVTEKGPYKEIDEKLKNLGQLGFPRRSTWPSLSKADFHGLDRWMYDYIQENSERARTLLPKLRAEADFCSYLGAAFLLLPIVSGVVSAAVQFSSASASSSLSQMSWTRALAWSVASWFVSVLLCFSGSYRTKRLILRMLSMLWVIVRRQGE
jgi:hypothetical protein